MRATLKAPALFVTVFVVATAGLVYELVAGTLASYVLGDSVLQFSTTIGTYLFAMGIGSFLSRYIDRDLSHRFVEVEIATALVGGLSAPFLFLGFAYAGWFHVLLYGTLVVIGTLVGLEIPLLMRILKDELDFKELVARVLTVDYLGSLLGSILFALLLVPRLGLNRTSLLFGMANGAVGLLGTWVLADLMSRGARLRLRALAVVVLALLAVAFVRADRLTRFGEQALYADPIVYAVRSPYQRIVLTKGPHSVQLFLNGNLQFSSTDEHRYHEALVHPVFAAAPRHRRVLILGGGDGLALREVFRYPDVERVTLVDLDAAVTDMARHVEAVRRLNHGSLDDPRVHVVHDDAMVWLDEHGAELAKNPYDVLIVDFPDPNNFSLGKLYTSRFYALARRALADDGAMVVQSTSPFYARKSFWCIDASIRAARLHTRPYHATVPSFGEWGYVLAEKHPFDPPDALRPVKGLRYLTGPELRALFEFPKDMARVPVAPNRLDDQQLVRYYEADWSRWN